MTCVYGVSHGQDDEQIEVPRNQCSGLTDLNLGEKYACGLLKPVFFQVSLFYNMAFGAHVMGLVCCGKRLLFI